MLSQRVETAVPLPQERLRASGTPLKGKWRLEDHSLPGCEVIRAQEVLIIEPLLHGLLLFLVRMSCSLRIYLRLFISEQVSKAYKSRLPEKSQSCESG